MKHTDMSPELSNAFIAAINARDQMECVTTQQGTFIKVNGVEAQRITSNQYEERHCSRSKGFSLGGGYSGVNVNMSRRSTRQSSTNKQNDSTIDFVSSDSTVLFVSSDGDKMHVFNTSSNRRINGRQVRDVQNHQSSCDVQANSVEHR
ncbi:protein P [Acrasis kona]|uniref:Protein P n=1 Tax=Acrasis kona TaxID=1008807 RepID=A0AAW2ZEH4_9EUKA